MGTKECRQFSRVHHSDGEILLDSSEGSTTVMGEGDEHSKNSQKQRIQIAEMRML